MDERTTDYFKQTGTLISPDEFLLHDIKSFHYKVVDEGKHVWMEFYMGDGSIGHLNIFLNDGRIQARYEEGPVLGCPGSPRTP